MSDNPAKDGGSDKLLFGKYKTPEDAERGFRNQTMELDKWKSVATTQQQQLKVLQETLSALQKQVTTPASREEPIALANEEGQVDPRAIERLIEARQKPILDALKQVPKMMEEQIRSFLAPVQSSLRAKTEFFAREDIDAKFTDGELQKVLQRNPGINKAFEMLMSSPDTQPHAYEAVYELWRSTAGQVAKTEPPQGKRHNIVMMGFLTALADVVSPDAMRKAVLASVPKGTEELNLKAFEKGYEYGQLQEHEG